ncbi:SAM-dependent methyltransferase [Rhodoplanes sp. Z2-YC6860]|uniref:SAM-dependent methyltransferase n=1 Tax=Rhodoplanes sp. Z2-YC6860 TaxID=674703 RepID=UPI00078D1B75|nr:cyclopropane-fatty-acyl-phospholipid synthase family protein [Rhodoplanes sp. Z2-YC6860]AMN42932.1 methyltransferase, cyclopropane fatty acid synthase [Rhodoplanes sp. Z2-YC6860]
MDRLLVLLLRRFVRRGTLRITTAGGLVCSVGDGTGRPIAIRFTTSAAQRSILLDPELHLGEAYMDGTLQVEEGTLADFLALVLGQTPDGKPPRWARLQWILRYVWRRLQQFNVRSRSRQNVAHHYDLDGRLYSLFLDADRQYSCAYFETPDQSLDDAQLAKKRHIAAKLRVKDGHRVLDIGCGWGGLALYIAEFCRANVLGVTLSNEQFQCASGRAAEKNLSRSVEFRMQDYRDVPETFDRIVSVGMFEHVGVGYYDAYFQKCAELLDDDGVMLLHSIGRSEGPNVTNPWIAKYIFPGGYIPALSEVLPAIERAGLLVTDIEILRLHYAETLKAWRDRFMAHREEAERIYDQRFVRMWEFYLAASEMAFREQGMMVMQYQLTKRQNVVPITRDYIMREEARLRSLEGGQRPPLRLAGE